MVSISFTRSLESYHVLIGKNNVPVWMGIDESAVRALAERYEKERAKRFCAFLVGVDTCFIATSSRGL